jgi:Cu(I)/Ag(I) efflux system membrane fusion protein
MNRAAMLAIAAALLGLAAFGGYRFAVHRAMTTPAAVSTSAPAQGQRKVLYWHDPMFPQQKFDKPGKSPFMDMQLVPVYADQAAAAGPGVSVSANTVQNLGIRTALAESGSLEPRMEAVGSVGWNERNVALVQSRAAGFVEKLHARAPLDHVARGAPLVELLIPEWAGAQEEFLFLSRKGEPALAGAARRRLVLLGMSEAAIAEIERRGQVQARFTLHAPVSGVIAELGVREGMTVTAGQTLFRIVDLSSVWVTAEVPEAQAAWLVPGAAVEARVPAWPGVVFAGRVGALLPDVNATTRTIRSRIEVANPGERLKPGMFATLSVSRGPGKATVLVPSEAVIRTGERNVVIVAEANRFVPVDVQVGQELGGRSEILKGITAGTKVVVSGQFLIDSEASLKSALSRLESAKPAPAAGALHAGSARVTRVDSGKNEIELDHGPMPSLNWPAMQMGFVVSDPRLLAGVASGDSIEFEIRGEPDKDGSYVIEKLRKKGAR